MAAPRKVVRRKPNSKKTNKKKFRLTIHHFKWIAVAMVFIGLGIWFGISFKDGIKYFFSEERKKAAETSVFDIRNVEVLKRHSGKVLGFDISHYQGDIQWEHIDMINNEFPLEFVFVRATMGKDGIDTAFLKNWRSARANNFIRGAYHYYRPNENSMEQAQHFIQNVKLGEGDFPPVLDIEELPKNQSMDSLISGLKRWMNVVELHYGVKPILYSGEHYFNKHLQKAFPDYIVWIANYNFFVEDIKPEWHFWQFTEKGIVPGIETKVDVNIYNGNRNELRKILIH
ncbi:glycoside hydrolase family 25 protein [Flavobacterium sp. NKUCC04_CG]|uniref:glycoside hydrolase family 25 protein n=1 Tax=Flavobacterium sp. NKUCC04_CG TaxID=2842121 RepID=UPI001C5A6AD8|nr:glycoside hydrolase family 25 protein [Flavobacterium sp. NKUCC04_CG]MBW3518992.1 glycoside hydrolase family 25 protein [Flavobacterium sp. NKUCC04_CG]